MDKARDRRADRLIIGILILLTLAVYWQVWDFELVNFDDDVYIEKNPVVLAGLTSPGVRWALTANYQANWHPLTWISLMVDAELVKWNEWLFGVELGRESAGVYHLSNVALHLANTLLLFAFLAITTRCRGRSFFVAALFAVHPLHVESVAWVAERKDVLSALFWMLTMLAYVAHVQHPSYRRFGLLLCAFFLGLASKPMLVSLPLVLLLLDVWPLRRLDIGRECVKQGGVGSVPTPCRLLSCGVLLTQKLPLIVLATVSCVVTLWAQRSGGAVADLAAYPLGVRIANAIVAYVAYIGSALMPRNMAVLYVHPGTGIPVWQVVGSAFLLASVTLYAVSSIAKRPYLAVGWFWYLVTLVPVIGLVQVGKQPMADRYTYIPLIGIFIIIAWGVPDLIGKLINAEPGDRRVALPSAVLGAVAVLALMIPAYVQVGYWRNSITLFSHAIKVTRGNSLAHNNLGTALLAKGDTEGAIRNFRLALKYHPEYLDADYNLGNALYEHGDIPGAIRQYRKVIHIAPKHTSARNNLGSILAQQGKYDEAIEQYSAILDIDPNNEDARQNLEQARSARAEEL